MFAANQSQVLGTIIFNYAFVTSIPSWVNEKHPGVNVNVSIWSSTWFATITFLLIGYFGGCAYDYPASTNLLTVLSEVTKGKGSTTYYWFAIVSKYMVYLFPMIVLVSSIPILSIVIRYNLAENKICPVWMANLLGIVLPWVLSVPAYTGPLFMDIANWSSILFTGFANFTIPFILYAVAKKYTTEEERRARVAAFQLNQDDEEEDVGAVYSTQNFPKPIETWASRLRSAIRVRLGRHEHDEDKLGPVARRHRSLPWWWPFSPTLTGLVLALVLTLVCVAVILMDLVILIQTGSLANVNG